jgi:hypothetical protein
MAPSAAAPPRREQAGPARRGARLAESTSPDLDGVGKLDSELAAVFEPGASAGALSNPASVAQTEIQLGPADVLDGPPKDEESDAVDDLFMELIED